MPGSITLSCPACGHTLQFTEDTKRLTCSACGTEHNVDRSGEIISLKPTFGSMPGGMDEAGKIATQLSNDNLRNEIKTLAGTVSLLNQLRDSRIRIKPRSFTCLQGIFVYVFCFSVVYLLLRLEATGNDITKLSPLSWLIPAISFVVTMALFPIANKERKDYNRKTAEQNKEIDEKIQQVRELLEIKKAEVK